MSLPKIPRNELIDRIKKASFISPAPVRFLRIKGEICFITIFHNLGVLEKEQELESAGDFWVYPDKIKLHSKGIDEIQLSPNLEDLKDLERLFNLPIEII